MTPGGSSEVIESTPSAEPGPGPAVEAPFGGRSSSPPSPGGEPPLDLGPITPSEKGASLVKPQKSSAQKNRRSPSVRLRQAGLTNELKSYVNDPEDLFLPPKSERPWKYVVLHHSANEVGNYDQIDHEHRKTLGWNGCGYHFIIGNGTGSPDGQIEVSQRWSNQKHGVHCRNGKTPEVNEYGIGICLVGDLDDKPPTPRQIAAAKALVSYLGQRYSIPADHMGSHAQLANSPTACPGKHFPAQAILGSSNLALR
ncbi:peptidoglycan recognition protein family protein [Singulisphaera sp. PoT]|uniref:peptidoglycan recognition protein family protein n=1 Tax=Singulisphaera sp. PoT TaxID=3411797 RepID=UPI003BF5F702